jgi:predicted porin
VGTVGAEETGLLGMSFLAFGGSGGADATGSGADAPQRQRWKRREVGLTYYESPRFGGFQVLGAFSPGNSAVDGASAGAISTTPNAKPRVISLAGIYSAGPLGIGIGYERHEEFGIHGPATTQDADDRGWGASISYKFGPVEVGATYLDTKYETLPGQELKKRTATVGVEWAIAGPHAIHAQYGWAGDSKGNSTVGVGGARGHAASGPDTGGDQFSIAYQYRFSKRTSIKLGYVHVDNDSATTTYRIGNSAGVTAGEDSSAVAFLIRHRF